MSHHPISHRSQSKFGRRPRICSTHSSHSSAVCRTGSTNRPRPCTPVRLRSRMPWGGHGYENLCDTVSAHSACKNRRGVRDVRLARSSSNSIFTYQCNTPTLAIRGHPKRQEFLTRDRPFRFPKGANASQSRGFLSVLPGGIPSGSAPRSPFADGIPCSACAVAHQRDII